MLTGTRLRKHVGTMMTLLNLRDHELDAVADFMGHDIRVHRRFYRLSSEPMQLAKISKVLINMERGNIDKMKGLNLDEVQVDDLVEDIEDEVLDDPVEEQGPKKAPETKKRTRPLSETDCTSSDSSSDEDMQFKPSKRAAQSKPGPKRQQFEKKDADLILKYFERLIINKITPQKHHVQKFMETHKQFATVPWEKIKNFVRNRFLSLQNKEKNEKKKGKTGMKEKTEKKKEKTVKKNRRLRRKNRRLRRIKRRLRRKIRR